MAGRARAARKTLEFLLLAGVVLLGILLRTAHIADSADSPFFSRPMIDGQAYDSAALAIMDRTLPKTPFYQDPLYPYFLAATYRVFGHNYWPVYCIQALLGCLIILLAWDMTRLLFDWRAGVAAGLIVACYRTFIFYEAVIDKTALSVFLTALFLWSVVRSLRSSGPAWPALSGVFLGLASLTRANLLVFAPLLIVLFAAGGLRPTAGSPRHTATPQPQPANRRLRLLPRLLLALAGLLLVIAPVSIRNSIFARELVLTTTQAGQNFYIGNSSHNRTGQYEAPSWVRPNPQFEEKDFAGYAREQAGRDLSYSQTSRFFFRAAFDWIRSSPAAFLKLLARKTILYLNNFEVPDNYDLGFLSRFSLVLRLPLLSFGLTFAFGFAGLLVFFRRSMVHLSLAAFFVVFSATVIAFFVLDRYRLPAVISLAPFAAGMLVWLWDRLRHKRYGRLAAGLALSGGCFVLTLYPLTGSQAATQAQSLVNLGAAYLQEGDTNRAVAAFQDALRTQPGRAEALRNLGILQLHRGNQAEALADLELAARAEPSNPFTHYYLGTIREARNELEPALAEYSKSVELKPSEIKFRFGLATAMQKLGRYPDALAQYDTLLGLAPDNPVVHHNRSVALFHIGRYDSAGAELDAARRLGGPVNPDFERLLQQKLGR